jgi:thiol-disulfide isomerase/thioredoxin
MLRLLPILLVALMSVSCTRASVDFTKPLDVKFTAVDGRKVNLADLRGKVVLIDAWATWCPPCRMIAPDILAFYKKYHAQGFEVIGISADTDKQALLDYIKKEGAPWPQYFDDAGSGALISDQLGIDSFPTLWLVGRDGKVVDNDFRSQWFPITLEPTSAGTLKKIGDLIQKQLDAK